MIVIIAEKPSVAASVAKVIGKVNRVSCTAHRTGPTGYIEAGDYRITWAFGHLVGLLPPEKVGFGGNEVPILPSEWKTDILNYGDMGATVQKQMKVLDDLFARADSIIVATDAGREGELIFRYIYEYLGHRTPFERLWISSLTDEAIRGGLEDLRPGREFEALSAAAHARSEADWLLGYNASRALRVSTGFKGTVSLGRVQTPVLGMICERTEANRNFVPTPFWVVTAILHKDMDNFPVTSVTKYQSEKDAKEVLETVSRSKRMRVVSVEKKQVVSKPPLLYDLTSLQRAANSKYGLTADQTLKTAQKLYEGKYLSYPRTGSRYISDDVYKTIPSLIKKTEGVGRFAEAARSLDGKRLCRRSVDGTKVTDHHALLPTEVFPTDLTGNEKLIWEMVVGRMLEAFGEDSVAERTTAEFDCEAIRFKATGSVPVRPGWKAVFGDTADEPDTKKKGKDDEDKEEGSDEEAAANTKLPPLGEGEVLPAGKIETVRKTDSAPAIYTENTLLGEMETCGKKIEDEELREALKDVGLGTPATRAQVIETLLQRNYIQRKGKKLLPTEFGEAVYGMVRGCRIADVQTSGEWERDLGRVERGEVAKGVFDKKIVAFTLEVIDDIKKNCKPLQGISTTGEPTRTCPCCGHPMANLKFSVLCDASEGKGGCGFKVNREIAGKKLPAKAIEDLCTGKRTAVLQGFTSKSGKKFAAALAVDKNERKVVFDLQKPSAPALTGLICPCCGDTMEDTPWRLNSACGFSLPKTLGGVPLQEADIRALLSGQAVPVRGMTSRAGKSYSAKVSVNTDGKKLDYEFINDKKKKK